MFHKLRARLTYANITATLALFLALGTGGAYAANTIFSTDIVDGQVKSVDMGDATVLERKLADGAVTSDKVRDNNLRSRDVLNDSLTGEDIKESSLIGVGGATGARGYAHVRSDGTLDAARTKNVLGVAVECTTFDQTCPPVSAPSRTQCFRLSFTPQNAVANGDRSDSGGDFANDISIRIPAKTFVPFGGGCPTGYTAASATSYSAETGESQAGGFWILFN